jgi:hypothetical protein
MPPGGPPRTRRRIVPTDPQEGHQRDARALPRPSSPDDPARPASGGRGPTPGVEWGAAECSMPHADRLLTTVETYLALDHARLADARTPRDPAGGHARPAHYRCTGHTWPRNRPPDRPGSRVPDPPRHYRCTGHTWPREPARPPGPGVLSITMNRTYLGPQDAPGGRSTLAILETYDACVHHDVPSIVGACTHDEPDILFTMYRTYLARALTMYRTYHYR